MGYLARPTPQMGEYSVEVRRESFIIRGEDDYDSPRRHVLHLSPRRPGHRTGSAEILLEDIPKIRAALDQAERIAAGKKLPSD
jgi:hypothetical protein